ncbi:DUF6261 family protein [uncultured Acetobacteroides sp.]|uniref:DUF6261 family protein n=1 Tax=uncultured Acetobacteroides sp. TaxID=1760811 RepID=UPI0029F59945|nr:DUF6261 family protein [uncultured Acetobacteroides sp.]
MELLKLDYHRLTNGESITYFVDLRSTVEGYPTIKTLLGKVYAPFSDAIDLTIQASSKVDSTLYSTARADLNTIRRKAFLHFKGGAESALKSSDPQECQHAQLVVNTIKLHGWRMQALPPDKFSANLQSLLNVLETEKLKAAIAGIGIGKALANLKGANAKFLDSDRQRISAWAEQNDVSTSTALRHVAETTSNLFAVIGGLLLTSDEPLLKEMVEKMNVITVGKQQTLKAKATRAENAKKEGKDKDKDKDKNKDKPVEKKSMRKLGKKGAKAQDGSEEPEDEAAANQLVEQQLVMEKPAAALPAEDQDAKIISENKMDNVV